DDLGSGSYAIELQRADGLVLFTRSFEPSPYFEAQGANFAEVLPFFPATKRVVIRRDISGISQTLAVVERSNNSPKVEVITPNGGETWTGSELETIAWSATDADGDTLHYAVQYSTDGGQSWHTLAVD